MTFQQWQQPSTTAKSRIGRKVKPAAGKPAPRFDFLWTENLARALKTQLDLYWSVLLSSDSYAKSADGIVTVFAKEIYPYFRGEIKLSRLLVEYTRRSPEKAFLLACPSVQKLLKDENVDLNKNTSKTQRASKQFYKRARQKRKMRGGICKNFSIFSYFILLMNFLGSLKANPSTPYKPILPVRSSSSDEIQTTSSQNDADVVVIEQGTSNATTSNGDVIAGNF
ncbi:hypothetical protein DICVIV_08557 [Dictyocaulus viviparus]|uniref:Uncharacterized protein n=1 Tax=Dictyocaulus viviparus TaxID=29172 RepID=A0A0D8XLI5_DICVI|nr:hypothetical protein DICVIV_08557 [Dictyocaulus viviparus]